MAIHIERRKELPGVPSIEDKTTEDFLRRLTSNIAEERNERLQDFGRITAANLLTTVSAPLTLSGGTLSWSLLGLQSLTDPDADRIFFWDDSASASKWLAPGNSIAVTTTTLDAIQDIRTTAGPTFDHLHLTSGQVGFPATEVLSADANTLDDYEEGTWTPLQSGLTVVGTPTYVGTYIKIGSLVFLYLSIAATTSTSSAGADGTYFYGLPATITPARVQGFTVTSYGYGTIGNGYLWTSGTGRIYLPAWAASPVLFTVSIVYSTV